MGNDGAGGDGGVEGVEDGAGAAQATPSSRSRSVLTVCSIIRLRMEFGAGGTIIFDGVNPI